MREVGASILVGPFELLHLLGAGGMGEVWAASHVVSHLDVALKVIASDAAWSDAFRRAFRNEVRAAASLDHPAIVTLLDAGEVDAASAVASEGRLVAGSPYFVTERLMGGSLADWVEAPRRWPEVLDLVLPLLDGLAHAHARGVVHRDLKPANVLLDARGRGRLTDFGIAHLRGGGCEPSHLGTPPFLAPEQLLRAPGTTGPWTDVYGFGCTLWALVTGQPPFGDLRGEALRAAHLAAPRPRLLPTIAVPSGLERILQRMIAAAPQSRYLRSAEVSADLRGLGRTDRPGVVALGQGHDTRQERTPAPARTTDPLERGDERLPIGPVGLPVPIPTPAEPPPEPERANRALRGAGIGLFGLRTPPLVGRTEERAKTWEILGAVHRGEGPQLLILRGSTGTGKSRLSAWLGEQAHALLGAEVWTAGDDDTGALVRSWLGAATSAEVERGLPFALTLLPPGEDLDLAALRELAAPRGRVRFTDPDQRYGLLRALVTRAARERLVVVRLEDPGADVVALARRLVDHGPARLLVVITAREDLGLEDHPRATTLAVDPLGKRDRLRLVQELLPLEPSLAARIAERGGGNPLFTVQLVGQLVAKGVLEGEEGGFRLRADPGPIADLADVWAQRLEALLAGAHPSVGLALEVAAALGARVDGDEWRAALARAEIPAPRRIAERLVESGLARADGDPERGFALVHPMLRDALQARAEAGGRWASHHRACAETLVAGPDLAERRGRHLLEAGAPREAAERLRAAALERVDRGEHDAAEALLDVWEAAMTKAGAIPRDPEWGRGWRVRHLRAYARGDLDAADTWAQRVADHARWHGWPELECRALLDRCGVQVATGQLDDGAALLARAHALPIAEEPALRPWVRLAEGLIGAAQGDDRAAVAFAAARAGFEVAGDVVEAANAARYHAMVMLRRGGLDEAALEIERARALFVAAGHPAGQAAAENTLGEIHRARGDFASAERWYRAARDGMRRMGVDRAAVPSTNLAIVLLEQGRAREARAGLESVAATTACRARAPLYAAVRALVLEAVTAERDWASFDRVLESADSALVGGGRDDPDTVRSLERAVGAARAAGENARAERIAVLRARLGP